MSVDAKHWVVCEGHEDRAFFVELSEVLGLPVCNVMSIGDNGTGPGIGGLLPHLRNMVGLTGFRDNAEHLLILADNEDDQDKTFKDIVQCLKNANGAVDSTGIYSIPTHPFQKASSAKVAVTVVINPVDTKDGCLETLLWRYLCRKYPSETSCVEQMLNCVSLVGKTGWTAAKIDKVRMRAGIGVLYKENPGTSIQYLWSRFGKRYPPSEQLIPLTEPEFAGISGVLSKVF